MKTLKITRYSADNSASIIIGDKMICTITSQQELDVGGCSKLVAVAYDAGYKAAYRDMRDSFDDWVCSESSRIQERDSIITKIENMTL